MADLFNSGIRPLIDAHLLEKSKEVRSYGDYWSASSAGYCMRLQIMRRLGVPKVPELADNATQTRIFEAGHIFHEWLQRITENAGLSIAQELELQDQDLMIRGHIDDLVLVHTDEPYVGRFDKEGNLEEVVETYKAPHLILYDYKTAHSESFNYKKLRNEIGHYHKMQLGTYMYMLRHFTMEGYRKGNLLVNGVATHEMITNLTEARILSISKDDLRMHEDQLMWTPNLEKEIVEYWKTLNGYWKERKLPKCTCLDFDGGFMGRRSKKGKIYNDFYYQDEPCSLEWYKKWKEENAVPSTK